MLSEVYLFLGSSRLSPLREDYGTSAGVSYSKIGAETRHLILERLPLFLHEHPMSRTKVPFNWLNEEKNFIVKVFGKRLVTKSLHCGEIRDAETHEASTVARGEGRGPIKLWLAGTTQVDMYERASPLFDCFDFIMSLHIRVPNVNDLL